MNDDLNPDKREESKDGTTIVDLGYYGNKKRKPSDELNVSTHSENDELNNSKSSIKSSGSNKRNRMTLKRELGYGLDSNDDDDNGQFEYSQR